MNTKKKDLYGQIIKYTGIFGSIQGLSILTGVIRNKIMAVMLGTGGMGLMSSTVIPLPGSPLVC